MRVLTALGIGLVAATTVTTHAAECSIPFPQALDAAAVVEDSLDDVRRKSAVLGNGGLNALLFSQGGAPAED